MINIIKNCFKNLDDKIKTIMKHGFKFSFAFCIFSTIILAIYTYLYMSPMLYYCGTILFKTSIIFFSSFVILGIGFDTMKKQMA